MNLPTWKERLAGRMPEALDEEIDVFETQMTLRRQGRLDEKIFAETRLRRGLYGQRYDNGQRHDGLAVKLSLREQRVSCDPQIIPGNSDKQSP